MRNIKLVIEYDGTNYQGWQKQPKLLTISGILEEKLSKLISEKIKLIGASRTDSGVHSFAQVANFKAESNLPDKVFLKALNNILPPDIIIKNVQEVSLDFHSRFNAKSKTYKYFILNSKEKSVFSRNKLYYFSHKLNLALIQKAIKFLKGKHDFTSFCSTGSYTSTNVRTITNFTVKTCVGKLSFIPIQKYIVFTITGSGFLRKMIRNIIGTLIKVGTEELTPADVKNILKNRNRKKAFPPAPACGLYLAKIEY